MDFKFCRQYYIVRWVYYWIIKTNTTNTKNTWILDAKQYLSVDFSFRQVDMMMTVKKFIRAIVSRESCIAFSAKLIIEINHANI